MRTVLWTLVCALGLNTVAAASPGDDILALRRLLDEDRAAHLNTDAALLTSHLADTLVSVDGGAVELLPRAEAERFFSTYFSRAVYHAWDDVSPPLIRLSSDGVMAWVVRRVHVDREEPKFGGGRRRREFTSAWTATYEKTAGDWLMTSVTSTFVPGVTEADRILASVRRALGGDDTVRGIRNVLAEAEVFGPGESFTVAVRSARSGEVRIDWSTGFSAAIAPDTSWSRSGEGAPAPLAPEVASLLRGHEAHFLAIAPETRYGPLALTGTVEFEGQTAFRLSGTDPLGGAFEFFVAVEDSLPLGYTVVDHAGNPELPVIALVDQWEEQAGIRLFRNARFRQGDEIFHYRYTRVDPRAEFPPELLAAP